MQRSVYRLSRAGSLRRLTRVDEVLDRCGDHELTIAVKAIGLNFADIFTILGLYRAAAKRDCVPGIEFSGEVVDVGSGVSSFHPGDRVMGSIRFGAYATHLNIDQRYLLPLPASWSYEEGAAFIVQALTAYYALLPLGNLQPSQTVLIHSAVGGVGVYANRIAKQFGAFTIGTVGTAAKVALALQEGYDKVIVRSKSFPEQLSRALNGRALDLVLDSIGGKVQAQSFDQLTTSGRLVAYGLSQFASHRATPNYLMLARRYLGMPRYHTLRLIESNKSVLGFNLIWLYDRVDLLKEMLGRIQAMELRRPLVSATLPFDRLPEAVMMLQSGGTTGKVVVSLS
jgi:NADPH:quinone reductase-like Zn-dependent oxidoreductase